MLNMIEITIATIAGLLCKYVKCKCFPCCIEDETKRRRRKGRSRKRKITIEEEDYSED